MISINMEPSPDIIDIIPIEIDPIIKIMFDFLTELADYLISSDIILGNYRYID